MSFRELPELVKGLSDLPVATAAVLFGVLLARKKVRRWPAIYLLIAVSAFLGAAAHCLAISGPLLRGLWCVLYVPLFALVRLCGLGFVSAIAGADHPERPAVRCVEAGLYLSAAAFCLLGSEADIYFFVAFAAVILVRVAVCLGRHPRQPRSLWVLLGILLAAVLFQALKTVIPHGVVWAHVMVLAALFALYRSCLTASPPRRAD